MINRAILLGRLTKEPELRYTPSGIAVATFTLAVERRMANQQGERETEFIPVVVWRQLAESCAQYLKKGQQAAVEGRIQVRNYENKEGRRVYVTEIVAENVQFLGGGQGQSNGGQSSGGHSNSRGGGSDFNDNPFASNFPDDDLPF